MTDNDKSPTNHANFNVDNTPSQNNVRTEIGDTPYSNDRVTTNKQFRKIVVDGVSLDSVLEANDFEVSNVTKNKFNPSMSMTRMSGLSNNESSLTIGTGLSQYPVKTPFTSSKKPMLSSLTLNQESMGALSSQNTGDGLAARELTNI